MSRCKVALGFPSSVGRRVIVGRFFVVPVFEAGDDHVRHRCWCVIS